jgi:hypothetical protein
MSRIGGRLRPYSERAGQTRTSRRSTAMKYMLLMSSASIEGVPPMHEWAPEDARASGAHMMQIHQELTERGELLGGEALAGPEAAKIVTSDGVSAPVVTDGPFPEAKELLAGFWMVDVESEARAIEIAAQTSAAPGPGGRPTRRPIEVRAIMTPPIRSCD